MPVIGGYFIETLTPLISIYFMKDSASIAAMGIGFMFLNTIGSSLFFSLATGFEAKVAQAYGAKDLKLCNTYFQKTMTIITILFITLETVIMFSENILAAVGIQPDLVAPAATYMKYSSLSAYFSGLLWSFCAYLNAQNIFSITLVGSLVAIPSHLLCCIIFCSVMDSDIIAVALAKNLSDLINLLGVYFYTKYKRYCEDSFLPFSFVAFKDLWSYFRLIFTSGAIIYVEWISFELFTLQAGHLQDAKSIAVHIVLTNLCTTYYQFGEGVGIILTSYVGNALGAAKKWSAIRCSFAGFVVIGGINLVATTLLLVFQTTLANCLFKEDNESKIIFLDILHLFIIFVWLDSFQVTLSGIMRGIGKATATLISYLFALYIVGQTLSNILAFREGMKLQGVWWGMIGAIALLLVILGFILLTTDFNKQIEIIKAEISSEDQKMVSEPQEAQI